MTQPLRRPPAPQVSWPSPTDATYVSSRGARRPRRALWVILGFFIGCALTAVTMVALLAPPRAQNTQDSSGATALKVTITDALLTQSLAANQSSAAPATVTQVHAHIQASGDVLISGVLQGSSQTAGANVTFDVQPYVAQHTLMITILRASISGNALPVSAFDALRNQVNQQLAQSSHLSLGAGQPLVVKAVSFADGELTVSYAVSAT